MRKPVLKKIKWQLLGLLFVFSSCAFANLPPVENSESPAALIVRHPYNDAGDAVYKRRVKYFLDLLQLALQKSGQDFELQPVQTAGATVSRSTRNLENHLYDVHWLHTTEERERDLLPVRIPLYKGLIGWRVLMTREDFANRLEAVSTINELRFVSFGLGYDWPDTFVMQENGFDVKTAVNRTSMYLMLRRKRTDVITRSVLEVWEEERELDYDDVVIEQDLVLQYASAYYFFFPKQNADLAKHVERGLEIAVKEGSFDRIFWDTYGDDIRRSRLLDRKILYIANPLIPKHTPVDRAELWFSLTDLEKHAK